MRVWMQRVKPLTPTTNGCSFKYLKLDTTTTSCVLQSWLWLQNHRLTRLPAALNLDCSLVAHLFKRPKLLLLLSLTFTMFWLEL